MHAIIVKAGIYAYETGWKRLLRGWLLGDTICPKRSGEAP